MKFEHFHFGSLMTSHDRSQLADYVSFCRLFTAELNACQRICYSWLEHKIKFLVWIKNNNNKKKLLKNQIVFFLPFFLLLTFVLQIYWFMINLGSKDSGAVRALAHPTSVARAEMPASKLYAYVGWVCCSFSPLLREVFPRVLQFSPLLKNKHFQILIRAGIW